MKTITLILTFLIATNLWAYSQEDLIKATTVNEKPNMVTTAYLKEEGKYIVSIPLREFWLNEDRKEIFELAQKTIKPFAKDYYLKLVEFSKIFLSDKEKQDASIEELRSITKYEEIPDLKDLLRAADPSRDAASEILSDNERVKKLQVELDDISKAIQASLDEIKIEDYDFLEGLRDRTIIPSALMLTLPQVHFSKEFARNFSQNAAKLPSVLGPAASFIAKLALTNTSFTPVILYTAYQIHEYDFVTQKTNTYIKHNFDTLLMAQKASFRARQDGSKQMANLRVGFGMITGELASLQDLNGVFTGASFHMMPSALNADNMANYRLNIKVGTIMPSPLSNLADYGDLNSYAKNNYVIVSRQFNKRGVTSDRLVQSLNWNNGLVTTIKNVSSSLEKVENGAQRVLFERNVLELEKQGYTTLSDGTEIKLEKKD